MADHQTILCRCVLFDLFSFVDFVHNLLGKLDIRIGMIMLDDGHPNKYPVVEKTIEKPNERKKEKEKREKEKKRKEKKKKNKRKEKKKKRERPCQTAKEKKMGCVL